MNMVIFIDAYGNIFAVVLSIKPEDNIYVLIMIFQTTVYFGISVFFYLCAKNNNLQLWAYFFCDVHVFVSCNCLTKMHTHVNYESSLKCFVCVLSGSQDAAHDLVTLKKYNISHILNLACNVNNCYPDDFTYLTIELLDLPEFPILDACHQAIDFINVAINSCGCVLVHCNAGISRSATVVLAYLMKTQGMNLCNAYALLHSKRPCICPNHGFMIQLKTYEECLTNNTC